MRVLKHTDTLSTNAYTLALFNVRFDTPVSLSFAHLNH